MAKARRTDPETSHEAAAAVDSRTDCKKVLSGLFNLYTYGMERMFFTQIHAEENLPRVGVHIYGSGVRSRINELRKNGYLEWALDDEGNQAFYKPPTGRRRRYLRLTPKGINCIANDQNPVVER